MKSHLKSLYGLTTAVLFSAGLFGPAPHARALDITLVNPNFDLSTTKVTTGFTGLVTGWTNTGGTYTDSGIESKGSGTPNWAQSPSTAAFLRGSNGGAFQLSGYQLQNVGDVITLSWYAKNIAGGGTQSVSIITAASQSNPFSSAVLNATSTAALTQTNNNGPFQQFTLDYTVTGADVGKFVGLSFDNTNNTGAAYTTFDTFSLTASLTAVPEPHTYALALSGLLVVVVMVRRRKMLRA